MSELEELKENLRKCEVELAKTKAHLLKNESMSSLGSLVAGFTHDLSTPIGLGVTGMSAFVERTQKLKELYDKQKMSQEDFEGYLLKADKIADLVFTNLSSASERMLSFKRISVDQTSEMKRKFNLSRYFDDIVASLHNKLKHTKIVVTNAIDKDIELETHPDVYAQIFTNLILNSLIHAFDKDEAGLIKVVGERDEKYLFLEYGDNGKGVAKENLPKIFDAFFTTKINEGGSGLGMNIVRELATKRLMGTISATSKENEGLLLKLTLPLEIS